MSSWKNCLWVETVISRLNKKVISGAIWLLPLICPRGLKDFSKTHEAVDTPDQSTPPRKDAWTRAGRCGQQWRPQRPRLTDPLWHVPKAGKSSSSVCVVDMWVLAQETVLSQVCLRFWCWHIILVCIFSCWIIDWSRETQQKCWNYFLICPLQNSADHWLVHFTGYFTFLSLQLWIELKVIFYELVLDPLFTLLSVKPKPNYFVLLGFIDKFALMDGFTFLF